MKFYINKFTVMCAGMFVGFAAYGADEVSNGDFLAQVLEVIKSLGGLPWAGKVAAICLLIVASMKVSFLAPLWDKLGRGKALAAPILAMIGGIISMSPITLPGVIAYLTAGVGAIALHELLDWVKSIPGLGAGYIAVINFIQAIPFLGSGKQDAAAK